MVYMHVGLADDVEEPGYEAKTIFGKVKDIRLSLPYISMGQMPRWEITLPASTILSLYPTQKYHPSRHQGD